MHEVSTPNVFNESNALNQNSHKHDWRTTSNWDKMLASFDKHKETTEPLGWTKNDGDASDLADVQHLRSQEDATSKMTHRMRGVNARSSDLVAYHLNTPYYKDDVERNKTPGIHTRRELLKFRKDKEREELEKTFGSHIGFGGYPFKCDRICFEKEQAVFNAMPDDG